MKYFIAFLIIIFLMDTICPFLSFAKAASNLPVKQDTQDLTEAPGTFKEAKTLGKNFLIGLPITLKKSLEEGLSIWKNMFGWSKRFWNLYINTWIKKFWNRISSFFGKEVEKRKPKIEKEFQKEKEEMKEEIPNIGKSFWQRFMELVR